MLKIKELEQLFTKGKISRRDFITQVSALGLLAAVSPALLSTSARAATPKKGGRLKRFHGPWNTDFQYEPEHQLADQKLSCGNRSRIQYHP